MAIKNSLEQIVFPGLEGLVSDAVDAAVTQNATLSAIQTNLTESGSIDQIITAIDNISDSAATLPGVDPYPNWAAYYNNGNDPHWNVYDSNYNKIYGGTGYTGANFYRDRNSYYYTNGNINSSSLTTYWASATPNQQADGHAFISINGTYQSAHGRQPDYIDWWRYYGVVIGLEGQRQKFSLYSSASTIQIRALGAGGYHDTININNTAYSTWGGGTNDGMAGYNEKTGTLVVMEALNSSNSYRLHKWVNTGRKLNAYNYQSGTLYLFLKEAKSGLTPLAGETANYEYFNFTWNEGSSSSYNESRYRMRVIPGDNGIIGMARQVPSNNIQFATFTPSSSSLSTSFNRVTSTTSYGSEQGSPYGMRHQINWSNSWVAVYAPYYYYGSGMIMYYINVEDPRNYYTGSYGDSSNGCQIVPLHKNRFLFRYSSQNTDSANGFYVHVHDPEGYKSGRYYSGTISNGGAVSLTALGTQGSFDSPQFSTQYPVLVSVPHWKVTR